MRVLVPRDGSWGSETSALLERAGFDPVVRPLITIAPAEDQEALGAALEALGAGRFDWLVVTSQSTLRYLPHVPSSVSVAAVGDVTAAALRARGIPVAFVPTQQSAAGLVDEWPIATGSVLWLRALDAKPTVEDGLRAKGMIVVSAVAYRTVPADAPADPASALDVDAVLVTSGTVAKQVLRFGVPDDTVVVAIGAQTAEDCRRAGLPVTAVASKPSPQGLVDALSAVPRA